MNKYPLVNESRLSDRARDELTEIQSHGHGIMLDQMPGGVVRLRIYAPNSRRVVCQNTCTAGPDNAVHQGYSKWRSMQP